MTRWRGLPLVVLFFDVFVRLFAGVDLDARALFVVLDFFGGALLAGFRGGVAFFGAVDARVERVVFFSPVVDLDLRLDVERPPVAVCFFAIQQPPFSVM